MSDGRKVTAQPARDVTIGFQSPRETCPCPRAKGAKCILEAASSRKPCLTILAEEHPFAASAYMRSLLPTEACSTQ